MCVPCAVGRSRLAKRAAHSTCICIRVSVYHGTAQHRPTDRFFTGSVAAEAVSRHINTFDQDYEFIAFATQRAVKLSTQEAEMLLK